MKHIFHFLTLIFLSFTSLPLFAQETTPLPLGEGQGVGSFLTLEQLKDSALQNSFSMRKARLGIDAAREQRKEAFTHYFPNVMAMGMGFRANRAMGKMEINPEEYMSAEMNAIMDYLQPLKTLLALDRPMSIEMMKSGALASITALQPVFAGGQIVLGNKLARLGEEISQLQLQLSEKEVEAQVERYYWQLVSMNEKTQTLDAVDSMLLQIRHDVETAVKAGVALRNDLLQVQLRQNDIKSQRLKLNNGRELMWLMLKQFCGLSETRTMDDLGLMNEELRLMNDDLGLMNEDSSQLSSISQPQSSVVTQLPEYRLLEMGAEAAKLQRKMEVAKNLPTVAVGAGYNYHNLLENDRHFGMVFATVSLPITDWWGGSHAIRRKKIAEQEAQEKMADNAELIAINQRKAYNDVLAALSQLELAQQSAAQAEENLRIHRNTYRAGTATMTDLLQAQLLQQQARDQQTEAFTALQLARLDYRQVTR